MALRDKLRRNEADTTMAKQKIAIACQGGGSQTAFTAGVLSTFFEKGLHLQKQIVSVSGTSGGAVCAATNKGQNSSAETAAISAKK